MTFARAVKNKELAYISRLLSIFGVVEERQMRLLFQHLEAKDYGKIMTRLHREGMIYRTPDAKYLAPSELTAMRTDRRNSVLCFWAFIQIRDKAQDFCMGEPPTIITVASRSTDYDLIPLSRENITLINEQAEDIPERSVRYLITDDLKLISGVERRFKNDYVLHINEDGAIETYEW